MFFHLFLYIYFNPLIPLWRFLLGLRRSLINFFWGTTNEFWKILLRSWISYTGLSIEDGLGCKSIIDMANYFSIKLWWKFRLKNSLWANYMNMTYCGPKNPSCYFFKNGQSLIWHKLYKIMCLGECFVQYGLDKGNCFFWQDNLSGFGSLDEILNTHSIFQLKVYEFFCNGNWDYFWLNDVLPFRWLIGFWAFLWILIILIRWFLKFLKTTNFFLMILKILLLFTQFSLGSFLKILFQLTRGFYLRALILYLNVLNVALKYKPFIMYFLMGLLLIKYGTSWRMLLIALLIIWIIVSIC